jgi:hypothetical protein
MKPGDARFADGRVIHRAELDQQRARMMLGRRADLGAR